jgi:hypothetical protein
MVSTSPKAAAAPSRVPQMRMSTSASPPGSASLYSTRLTSPAVKAATTTRGPSRWRGSHRCVELAFQPEQRQGLVDRGGGLDERVPGGLDLLAGAGGGQQLLGVSDLGRAPVRTRQASLVAVDVELPPTSGTATWPMSQSATTGTGQRWGERLRHDVRIR